MNLHIPLFSLSQIFSNRTFATLYLVIMCIQIVPIEGYGISPLKVALMALAPLVFILKIPHISKALLLGALYWAVCYFSAAFNGDMRFSTIGYLGMFIISFIVFYNLVYSGAFTITYFFKLIRTLILAFGIALVLQQVCILAGIRSFWLINLDNQFFLSLTKLPSLTLEPSHTSRILSFLMLAYWRCIEIGNDGNKPTITQLFTKEHRWVSISFLWTMFTMGSGTAFVGIGILSLYFIERKTIIYIIPLLVGLFILGQSMELKQMDRTIRVAQAATTGKSKNVIKEDGSAAYRVIPIINTFKIDLLNKKSWVGNGTMKQNQIMSLTGGEKIGVVEQFGLFGFFASLILIFSCVIHKPVSLESLLFLLLEGFTLGNIYHAWAWMLIFTGVGFFKRQQRKEKSS